MKPAKYTVIGSQHFTLPSHKEKKWIVIMHLPSMWLANIFIKHQSLEYSHVMSPGYIANIFSCLQLQYLSQHSCSKFAFEHTCKINNSRNKISLSSQPFRKGIRYIEALKMESNSFYFAVLHNFQCLLPPHLTNTPTLFFIVSFAVSKFTAFNRSTSGDNSFTTFLLLLSPLAFHYIRLSNCSRV